MPVGINQTPTFSPHAHLQTLLKPTVLALVPVMLIDGTVPVPSTRVREISSYTSLEEALATCNKTDPIIHRILIAPLGVLRTVCPRTPFFWEVALRQEVNCSISFNRPNYTPTRRHIPVERSQPLICMNLMNPCCS